MQVLQTSRLAREKRPEVLSCGSLRIVGIRRLARQTETEHCPATGKRAPGGRRLSPVGLPVDIYREVLELLTWFAGKPENRRRYPRRSGGFRVWFATESGWTGVSGVDISASGMGLISPAKFAKDEINLRIQIENKAIMVRAKHVWCIPGTLGGRPVFRYGMHYVGIAADDWDALVRFCNSEPVTLENKAQKDLEMVRMQADDVARLIPQRLQERLLTMLVQARRLAPLEKEKTPLVAYSYGGIVKRGSRQLHRLQIHSRLIDELSGEAATFDSRFLFDDSGNDIEMETR